MKVEGMAAWPDLEKRNYDPMAVSSNGYDGMNNVDAATTQVRTRDSTTRTALALHPVHECSGASIIAMPMPLPAGINICHSFTHLTFSCSFSLLCVCVMVQFVYTRIPTFCPFRHKVLCRTHWVLLQLLRMFALVCFHLLLLPELNLVMRLLTSG
jgi:hypothetical protein